MGGRKLDGLLTDRLSRTEETRKEDAAPIEGGLQDIADGDIEVRLPLSTFFFDFFQRQDDRALTLYTISIVNLDQLGRGCRELRRHETERRSPPRNLRIWVCVLCFGWTI